MLFSSDTPLSFNEFCLAYYNTAKKKAWIILRSFINMHGTPPNNINLEDVVEDGVTCALERVYKTYNKEKENGASVMSYLDRVIKNCLVDQYYKQAGLVRKKKKKVNKENETGQADQIVSSDLFLKGVINKRLEMERKDMGEEDDEQEDMTYHSLEGERKWRSETLNSICNELTEQIKKMDSIDRIITEKWLLLGKNGYTQAAAEELGLPPETIYRRMNRIISKLRKKLEHRQEDYKLVISIDTQHKPTILRNEPTPEKKLKKEFNLPTEVLEAKKRVSRRRTDYKALRTHIEDILSSLLKSN